MTILNHNEITCKGTEYFYSVESDDNSYNDDEFNGSYEECVEYATKEGYDNSNCQIALIQVEDGCAVYCHEMDNEWC